jgi:hypothetical protein
MYSIKQARVALTSNKAAVVGDLHLLKHTQTILSLLF